MSYVLSVFRFFESYQKRRSDYIRAEGTVDVLHVTRPFCQLELPNVKGLFKKVMSFSLLISVFTAKLKHSPAPHRLT